MVTIDDVQEMLGEIARELPGDFFKELNGGIVLLEACKPHPQGAGLFIMGEYHRRRDMGRQILIYYGSFLRAYADAPAHELRERLRKTLLHEFTHHLESLAGERGLELKDQAMLAKYRARGEGSAEV